MTLQLTTATTTRKTSIINSGELAPCVHGQLDVRFEAREEPNRTILAECKQQLPLRIVRAFQLDDGAALVHLHNLSGGVLGGDDLDLTIKVGKRAIAQVTSTGATRIYRSSKDAKPAQQRVQISIDDDGLVEYLPDQLIPFADSRYRQETRIDLRANAGVFWWETVAPGREAHNEMFEYDLLQLKTWISAFGQPIAIEHMRIEPRRRSIFSLARLGRYAYFSTFYICRVGIETSRWIELERLLGELAAQWSCPSQTVWAISPLRAHGLVIRALSISGREITNRLPAFWRTAKRFLYDREAVLPRKIY